MKLSKEDLETFSIVIDRPGMFLINKVEDYYMFFLGYTFKDKPEISNLLIGKFSEFVKYKLELDSTKAKWHQMIRYSSSTDISSVELFASLFKEFIKHDYPDFGNSSN